MSENYVRFILSLAPMLCIAISVVAVTGVFGFFTALIKGIAALLL